MNQMKNVRHNKEVKIGYTSSLLLVKEMQQNLYRACMDFRVLNDKLAKINHGLPLIRDWVQAIGQSQNKPMSMADLRDAYHTLRIVQVLQNIVE